MVTSQLHKSHFREMMEKIEDLVLEKGHLGEIAAAYRDTIRSGQILRQPAYLHLLDVLYSANSAQWTQPNSLSEIYERGACFFVERLAGRPMASVIGRAVARLPFYPYGPSPYRRSFRTRSLQGNMRQFVQLLSCIFLPEDFDLAQWITMSRTKHRGQSDLPEDIKVLADFVIENLIALAIDEKDGSVYEAVHAAFLDKQKKAIHQTLLRGLLKSADQGMYDRLLTKLLAEPHDTLGQAILHMAEYGRVEAYLQMMACVLDNDLLRYESFLKAVRVWLGFGHCYTDQTMIERTARLALRYAQDPEACRQVCPGHDPAQVQAWLWAVSLYDWVDVMPILDGLLQRGSKQQKLTALSFATQLDNKPAQTTLVSHCLSEGDLDIACLAMVSFDMSYVTSLSTREGWQGVSRSIESLQDDQVRESYFQALADLLLHVPSEGYTLSRQPFYGVLSRESVYANLFLIAAWDFDTGKIEVLQGLMQGSDAETRHRFVEIFLVQPRTEKERAFLFACLKDKSMAVRLLAANRIGDMVRAHKNEREYGPAQLTPSEITSIVNLLALKSEKIQAVCMNVLLGQSVEAVCSCTKELCLAKTENKRLAGFALLAKLFEEVKITEKEYTDIMVDVIDDIPLNRRSAKEQAIMQSLLRPKGSEGALKCGLGLFDPQYKPDLLDYLTKHGISQSTNHGRDTIPSVLSSDPSDKESLYKESPYKESSYEESAYEAAFPGKMLFNVTKTRMVNLMAALCVKIEMHKDFAFTQVNYDLSEKEMLLGNLTYMVLPKTTKRKAQGTYTLDDFVLPEVWRAWCQENRLTLPEAIALGLIMHTDPSGESQRLSWVEADLKQVLPLEAVRECAVEIAGRPHGLLAMAIIEKIIYEFAPRAVFAVLKEVMLEFVEKNPSLQWRNRVKYPHGQEPVYLFDVREMTYFLNLMETCAVDDELFQQYAALCIHLGQMTDRHSIRLDVRQVARAVDLGLIKPDWLYRQVCTEGLKEAFLLLDRMNEENKGYTLLKKAVVDTALRVIHIELNSMDTTPVSSLALDIAHHEGEEGFVRILAGLQQKNLSWGGAIFQAIGDSRQEIIASGFQSRHDAQLTKEEVLLSLLQASVPGKNDSGESLRHELGQVESIGGIGAITEQTLLEAAMYLPAWTAVIAACLEWPGLFSAVSFIRVHTLCWCTQREVAEFVCSDNCSDEDKEILAGLTTSMMKEINNGVFAVDWLQKTIHLLGHKRFGQLLDAGGCCVKAADWTRLKLFVDATLKKISPEALYQSVGEKRSLNELIALGLVPLQNDKTDDTLTRYEFIQEFFTQSLSFGPRRRTREKKACAIALRNLKARAKSDDVSLSLSANIS